VVMTDLMGRPSDSSKSPIATASSDPSTSDMESNPAVTDLKTANSHVAGARWMAFIIGAVVVAASSQMGAIPGNITEVTTKTANLLTTPIFALFFFALFIPFANPKGVMIGCFFGVTVASLIAFGGPLVLWLHNRAGVDPISLGSELISKTDPFTGEVIFSCKDPISFQWIAPTAITVNIISGCIGSLIFRGKTSPPLNPDLAIS
jgi:solute:Na+ symporter, SSS family